MMRLESTSLDDAGVVVRWILREVEERQLAPGARLPTERELALRTNSPRSAVRRALSFLEAEGRITRHVGRGTFVAAPRTAAGEDRSLGDIASPADIMAVRLMFEPQIISTVVAAATGRDLREMQRCLTREEQATSFEQFELWDAALHRSFAEATHNELVARFHEMLSDARNQSVWGTLKRRTTSPERRAIYHDQHVRIVTAIRERDSDSAQQAMSDHLMTVRRHLFDERSPVQANADPGARSGVTPEGDGERARPRGEAAAPTERAHAFAPPKAEPASAQALLDADGR